MLERLWRHVGRRAGEAARQVAVCAAVGCGAGAAGAAGVACYALRAVHSDRRRGYTDDFVLTPEDLNMPYHEVQFFTEDSVSLTGWFIPQTSGGRPSRRVIVCCHPYNSSKSNLLGVARGLWEQRYSVFMFDFRSFAHTRTRQSVGYYEQRDARAAIACAKRNAPEKAAVGLIGASMGGAVSLIVGHEAEAEVVGIATDCAFASLEGVLETRVGSTLRLPSSVSSAIVRIASALSPFTYGYPLSAVAPQTAVANSERAGEIPLLLIHADCDDIVPCSHAHAIHSAAAVSPERKQLIVVQQCHHVGCFFQDRPGYIRQLVDFFDSAFAAAEEKEGASRAKSGSTSPAMAVQVSLSE